MMLAEIITGVPSLNGAETGLVIFECADIVSQSLGSGDAIEVGGHQSQSDAGIDGRGTGLQMEIGGGGIDEQRIAVQQVVGDRRCRAEIPDRRLANQVVLERGVRAVITDIPEPIAKADVVLDHDACRDGVVIAGADAVRAAAVDGVIVDQRVGRPAVADNPVKACVNHIVVCLIAVADKEAQAGLAAGYAAVVDEAVSDDVGAGISAVDTALFMNLDAEAVDVIERVAVNEVVRALDVHAVLQLGAADVVNRAPHNFAVADDAACVLQFNALGIMHVLDFAAPEPNMVRRARAGRGDVDTGGTQVGPVEDQVVELDIGGVAPADADGKTLAEGRLDGHRLAGVSGDGHATGPGDAAGDDVDQRLGVGTAPDVQ